LFLVNFHVVLDTWLTSIIIKHESFLKSSQFASAF